MNGQKVKDPLELPARWLHCPRKGNLLNPNIPFLPCKTPLDTKFNPKIPEENRFTPGMLTDTVSSTHNRELGLVIDLTKTDRFYDPACFTEDGVEYIKIKCAGFKQVPTPDQVNTFIQICDQFWNRNPLKVIAVHCTHGFNRTGFMIISYLIKKQSISVEGAFETFKFCRDPGIYKSDYIDELSRIYGDGTSDCMVTPELPSWCSESDDRIEDNNVKGNQNRKRRKVNSESGGKFMDGVGGIHPVPSQILKELRRKVSSLGRGKGLGFIGSQPVSLDINNINLLHQMPYHVSWKADGVRYMMLIAGEKQVYMIDRDNNIFKVPVVRFVFSRDINIHLTDTLLDGEMVLDRDGDKIIPRYLIYDIISHNGSFVGEQNFEVRLKIIQKELIDPRRQAMEKQLINRQDEPFGVRKKDFWFLSQSRMKWILDDFMKTLSHGNDGLILTPVMKPYCCGTTKELLKWKPDSMNSVDFRLMIEEVNKPGMLKEKVCKLYVGGMDPPYAQIPATKKTRDLHRRIVECVWRGGKWDILRVREDKSFPNSYETARNVVYSIQHPVTQQALLQFVEKHGWKPPPKPLQGDQKLMPPPKTR